MAQDFEMAKAFLKQAQPDGTTLYDHLTNVLLRIIQDKPDSALEAFETLSVQVKNATLKPEKLKEFPTTTDDSDAKKTLVSAVSKTNALLKVEEKDDDEDEEDGPAVPDMMADAGLFEWAGVGLPQEELYKIMRSITLLAKTRKLKSVRFFGKILGTGADYLVCEALKDFDDDEAPEEPPESKKESPGTGVNEFVYYVTNAPEQKWSQLPHVTPDQIILARQMRRFFTGDLNAPVLGFPRFPFGEAAYLRAQIARITHATVVSPKDFYTLDDESEEDAKIENEEFAELTATDLTSSENWTHHMKHILKQARCSKWEPPEADNDDDDDMDGDGDEEEEEIEDEPAPFLNTLDGDVDSKLGSPLWIFRASPHPSATSHAVASAHSLNWPGAVAVCKKKQFANIYVGYGHKALSSVYTPPPPPAIQSEFVAPYNPDEDEGPPPLVEQSDPLPPAEQPADAKSNSDDEGSDIDRDDDY